MPNVSRSPARKLMPSEALGRYLTYEDRRDRSFMAMLAAFSTVVRLPSISTVRELRVLLISAIIYAAALVAILSRTTKVRSVPLFS